MSISFKTVPEAMAWASSYRCLFAYVNNRPYPVWWGVETSKSLGSVVTGLTSSAGPVAILTIIGYCQNEVPGNVAEVLREYAYASESYVCRPLGLEEFDLAKIPTVRRHTYKTSAKHDKNFYQGKLF